MKVVLALDVSSKTGWALFHDEKPMRWGTVFPDKSVKDFGHYPFNFVAHSEYLADRLLNDLMPTLGDAGLFLGQDITVVIEETNASRQNYSQKMLEYLHFCIVKGLQKRNVRKVYYVRTGEWRGKTESKMSKEEKALNAKIGRIKKKTGKKLAKIDGKVVGKKGRKHVALRRVEEIFGIEMQRKDEDAADALLLGLGFIRGAPICDGTVMGGKSNSKKAE